MGIGGISFWQILIVLVVILVLFGGKKIRTMGSDLGRALKVLKKLLRMKTQPKILNQNQTINKNCYKLDFLRF